MKYISTRSAGGAAESGVSAAQAIKQGLAGDGGLFMPEELPELSEDDLIKLCKLPYYERAAFVIAKFLSDYTHDELLEDCREAYSDARFPGGPAPLKNISSNIDVLELWHGPTAAFKDMALQVMPRLLSRALAKTGEKRDAYILVATSGDTGKAALEGYRDVDRVKIMVFYPVSGVSTIQKLQMATQEGSNVNVCAVSGNFDDAQNGVKRIFADRDAAAKLDAQGCFLSSANSINWGRLVPQVVYYISAYCDMINNGTIILGDEINIAVPTGNFGNIFAAYIAYAMGLPVHRFVCASNRNNILTNFFETGIYDRNRMFYTTMSPSMDILISSNLERLLYLIGGSERTALYMKQLSETGLYAVDSDIREQLELKFSGAFCDESETALTIKMIYENYNYLIDTHTAVGLNCAMRYNAISGDKRRMLVVSTASPYKFASSVYAALTGNTADDDIAAPGMLAEYTGVEIPAPLRGIEDRPIRFRTVIEPADMLREVLTNASE
ncbi:MAG: threonine synthase [Clostridiales bacterium]|nr:threonine synthase [Clostridiales bacterium]